MTRTVLIVALLASGAAAVAQTIHDVPTTYATIQEAIDAAVDGDLILVASGTYSQDLVIDSKAIEIRGVGNVTIRPWVYLGTDGRFYVEGPRKKKLGSVVVIDIHPYQLADARGFDEWFGGVSRRELAEMLVPFFI